MTRRVPARFLAIHSVAVEHTPTVNCVSVSNMSQVAAVTLVSLATGTYVVTILADVKVILRLIIYLFVLLDQQQVIEKHNSTSYRSSKPVGHGLGAFTRKTVKAKKVFLRNV